jgi:hypothetical protein
VLGAGGRVWPQILSDTVVNLLGSQRSSYRHSGKRLLDGGKREEEGRVGTLETTYGRPDHLAINVRSEDGSAGLYWFYELQKTGGRPRPEMPGRRWFRVG